jgi:demethylmenaquinone methyltransferase/2-methoxy-6-polyprenyl-1,4-benzoquinol methylase
LGTKGHLIATRFFSSRNASSYDRIVKLTTFCQDTSWKKEMMRFMDAKNKLILDLACGTGILSSFIHSESANSRIIGTDLTFEYYLVKYTELSTMVREHWRVLRKGGIIIVHDFTYPNTKTMKILWHFYFKILRELGRVIISWRDVFSNLDKLIQLNPWVNNLIRELDVVGFTSISKKYYTYGTSAIVYARK